MIPEAPEHVTATLPIRPRDRAHYLAALAVGLATAALPDEQALETLVTACEGKHGDVVAARRRLYSSHLGSVANRREAARLLDIASTRVRAPKLRRPA